MPFTSVITHDGQKNAAVQITGRGPLEWKVALDLDSLTPRPKELKIDQLFYFVGENTEVQLAWDDPKARSPRPFLPIAGRGRVDFSEVGGIVAPRDVGGHIFLGVTGSGLFCVILDLSKH